jgi:hypothetical protein
MMNKNQFNFFYSPNSISTIFSTKVTTKLWYIQKSSTSTIFKYRYFK